jgi:hypothetical protein
LTSTPRSVIICAACQNVVTRREGKREN